MNEQQPKTEAGVVAELAKQAIRVPLMQALEQRDAGQPNVDVLIVPDGMIVVSIKEHLDKYRTAPERRKGTATFTDIPSFVAHVKRFADEDSVVFASDDRTAPSMTAVLDYNRATALGAPRFGTHRAHYAFPVSEPWKAWTAANKVWVKQDEFAAFLEQRLGDIGQTETESTKKFAELFQAKYASAAQLLKCSRELSIHATHKVESHKNLTTGEAHIAFAEEHSGPAGTPVSVPGAFLLTIAVFRSASPYAMPVRLRYRMQSGTIVFQYDIHRVDEVFEDAIRLAGDEVAKATALPVLYGSPEKA